MRQQIYDVLPGQPFGRGQNTLNITSDDIARAYCAGSSGSYSLSVGSKQGTFVNGDLILIHQTRHGTDADNWQLNLIVSGAGTSTFTLLFPLDRAFTCQTGSTSAERAQVAQFKEVNIADMSTLSILGWRATASYNDHGWGGIYPIAVNTLLVVNGTVDGNGKDGWRTSQDHNTSDSADFYEHVNTVGGGFRGGWNSTDSGGAAAGEGRLGSFATETTNKQTSGGGGANSSGAGGGGHKSAGEAGGDGQAGDSQGNDALTRAWMGGAGGGGHDQGAQAPSGGNGGALFFIWANRIKVLGGLKVNGGNGLNGTGGGPRRSAGGAGGGILINCNIADLGNNLVTAIGGLKGGVNAGDGSDGIIRINYGGKILSGSATDPVFTSAFDPKLSVHNGAGLIML